MTKLSNVSRTVPLDSHLFSFICHQSTILFEDHPANNQLKLVVDRWGPLIADANISIQNGGWPMARGVAKGGNEDCV